MLAAKNGHSDVVKYLLLKGANVYLRDKNGDTAMMIATDNEQEDIAFILRRAGAKPEIKPSKDKVAAPISDDEDDDDMDDTPDVDDLVSDDDAPDEIDLD